jgi:hypothetical protein
MAGAARAEGQAAVSASLSPAALLLVALGGALGSVARHLVSAAAMAPPASPGPRRDGQAGAAGIPSAPP